jgi:alcohol dehydrogenase YqhD (iron-dependent ADH family)
MESFSYFNPVKLLYGAGRVDAVGEEIAPYGKRVLLVYGRGHIKRTGVYDRVMTSLKRANLDVIELSGVQPNPRVELVRTGIGLCREEKPDFILAVGGGSVSDTAKAIGMGTNLSYDVWTAYEDFHHLMHGGAVRDFPHHPTGTLPVGVVMTKPGTGSEFDYTSVLSNGETREKLMVISKTLYPKFAVHDPELTYSLPRDELAYGVCDIMTHVMEQYFTRSTDTDILDQYKEANLRVTVQAGRRALADPTDAAAQSSLLYIAAWACSDQSMCGSLGGWAGHMMEHEMSAITDINHGHGMAIIYLPWMRSARAGIPAKFAEYGERVWGIERRDRSEAEVGAEAIDRTAEFWSSLGITLRWREAGVTQDCIGLAAGQAVRFGPLFSVNTLDESDVRGILEAAA